jgi:putative CocE/NonD family hydrolase
LALHTALPWAFDNDVAGREGLLGVLRRRRQLNRGARAAFERLPLGDADELVLGHRLQYYRDWLEHDDPADPWWQEAQFRAGVDRVACPVVMSGGWYDMFLPDQVEDFQRLAARGLAPRLVVGPWGHGGREHSVASFRQAFDLFDSELRGEDRSQAPAVRLKLVGGGDEWLEFDTWPPPGREAVWHLAPGGGLSDEVSAEPGAESYRYDPEDPTPGVGGTSLNASNTGPRDQATRESRADVLTHTSAPLREARTFIGPAEATIHLQSSAVSTDLHITVCDVDESGVSTNISSGIQRLRHLEPGAITAVKVRLWPVGAVFGAGHRLRIQVASGAHPTYARNLGTGEPILTGRSIAVADQTVHLGAATDSRVTLWEHGVLS